jgi:hypothetical protein
VRGGGGRRRKLFLRTHYALALAALGRARNVVTAGAHLVGTIPCARARATSHEPRVPRTSLYALRLYSLLDKFSLDDAANQFFSLHQQTRHVLLCYEHARNFGFHLSVPLHQPPSHLIQNRKPFIRKAQRPHSLWPAQSTASSSRRACIG